MDNEMKPTGERGTFKIERKVTEQRIFKVNLDIVNKEPVRGRWCLGPDGELVEAQKKAAADPTAPTIIQDTIPEVEYMGSADREMFTSRSALRRRAEADGYEITGGDHLKGKIQTLRPIHKSNKDDIIDDAKRAYNALKYGDAPLSEMEKERCKREQRELEAEKRRLKTRWA